MGRSKPVLWFNTFIYMYKTKKPGSKGNLTLKEQRFVKYWLEYGNGTKAVKKAGYRVSSDNAAGVLAFRLLRKTKIQMTTKEEMSAAGLTAQYRYSKLQEILEKADYRTVLQALKLSWELEGKLGDQIDSGGHLEKVEFVVDDN